MMQTTLRKYESLTKETFTEAKVQNLGSTKWTRKWAKSWKVWKGRLKSAQFVPPKQRRDKVNSPQQLVLFWICFQTGPSGGGQFAAPKNLFCGHCFCFFD